MLDDYDTINTDPIHRAVEFLIEHQPPQMHLVLVTRQDPPLAIPRWRVRNQVWEIGGADLRFTSSEAGAFLNQALKVELTGELISALEERTEGWVAGLQLAALSMQSRPSEGIASFVNRFSGSHRHVIDYLTAEVLAQQSDEIRTFLCQTSILDRLTAPLCDEITERTDSRDILKALDHANLFLIPLDEQRTWYRYHRLFADFLRTELDRKTQAALHLKASHWLAEHHLLPEAIQHSLAAGNMELAQQTIALAAADSIRMASLVSLQSWLDALPQALVLGHSDLATYQGYLLFFTGLPSQAIAYAEAAERAMPSHASPGSRGRLLGLKAHLALCADDLDGTIQCAREALVELGSEDGVFRSLTLNLLGQVLEARGDVHGAIQVYRQGIQEKRRIEGEVGALIMFTNLVFALNELGRRKEGVTICSQLGEQGQFLPGRGSIVAGGRLLGWSLLSFEANELERAADQVLQALEMAEQAKISDGVIWGRYILARIHLAQGDLVAARQIAQEGYQYAAGLDGPEAKQMWFSSLEAQISLLSGDLHAAVQWVRRSGLDPADTPHHWIELAYFTYVRILLAQRRWEDAQKLLDTMERSATEGKRLRKLITIHLLQASLNQARGQTRQAITCMENALDLAAAEGYLRAFLDEGQTILDLVPHVRHVAPNFVDQLLAGTTVAPQPLPQDHTLVEPISERELEILRLIAAGRSNPEIARQLYLSLNTVKWHAKNLYGKLGVGNRVEAVARAQELQLL